MPTHLQQIRRYSVDKSYGFVHTCATIDPIATTTKMVTFREKICYRWHTDKVESFRVSSIDWLVEYIYVRPSHHYGNTNLKNYDKICTITWNK